MTSIAALLERVERSIDSIPMAKAVGPLIRIRPPPLSRDEERALEVAAMFSGTTTIWAHVENALWLYKRRKAEWALAWSQNGWGRIRRREIVRRYLSSPGGRATIARYLAKVKAEVVGWGVCASCNRPFAITEKRRQMNRVTLCSRACITLHMRMARTKQLNEIVVREIRRRRLNGESARDIAADLGIHRTTVHKVISGRAWGHIQ